MKTKEFQSIISLEDIKLEVTNDLTTMVEELNNSPDSPYHPNKGKDVYESFFVPYINSLFSPKDEDGKNLIIADRIRAWFGWNNKYIIILANRIAKKKGYSNVNFASIFALSKDIDTKEEHAQIHETIKLFFIMKKT
ncbi:MAG: hypothetical protein ABIJ17_01495 [Patescibacteria group bacterium]